MIVICSAFRNSVSYLDRYFAQIKALIAKLNCPVTLICIEGDSADTTRIRLNAELWELKSGIPNTECHLVVHEHGHPPFGSTENPLRMKLLSDLINHALDFAVENVPEIDSLLWIESDLIWNADSIAKLLARVKEKDVDAISLLTFMHNSKTLYDVWAIRGIDNHRYGHAPSYHYEFITMQKNKLVEVSSTGSCIAFKGEVIKKARCIDDQAIVGLCWDARKKGARIFLDTELFIEHP